VCIYLHLIFLSVYQVTYNIHYSVYRLTSNIYRRIISLVFALDETIGNRTPDFPPCNAVPQTSASSRATY